MIKLLLLFGVWLALPAQLLATPWNLPQQLTSTNTQVLFEVDSTWHLVKGTANQIEGKLWLNDPSDFRSIRGTIRLPIAQFSTDNESRDKKMRRVMHADDVPDVLIELLESPPSLCDPATLKDSDTCKFEIPCVLHINKVTKHLTLSTEIVKTNSSYKVSSSTTLRWADFQIEDPSIFIAKLHDQVKIVISVNLNS